MAINRSKENCVVAERVWWAGTSQERRKGLRARDFMKRDEGMLLIPCEGVHTIGMRFPIDVAFLNAEGKILAVHQELRPWRFSKIVFRARCVLELAAGRLRETSTAVGDIVEIVELS